MNLEYEPVPVVLGKSARNSERYNDPFSELVVASLFAQGQANKGIAKEIGVSPHTVRNQLKSIYLKLGISNRTSLAERLRDLS